MIDMIEELRRKVLGWINLGPLGTIDGREQDMRSTVEALGSGNGGTSGNTKKSRARP